MNQCLQKGHVFIVTRMSQEEKDKIARAKLEQAEASTLHQYSYECCHTEQAELELYVGFRAVIDKISAHRKLVVCQSLLLPLITRSFTSIH